MSISQAQYSTKKQKVHIYKTYDQAPVPPGGVDGFTKYLAEHIHYPSQAIEAKAQGNVYISVIVNKDGSQSDECILKDNVGYGCALEALRVIKGMPPWREPAFVKGKPILLKYIIPIRFIIYPEENYDYRGNKHGCDTLPEPIVVMNYSESGTICLILTNQSDPEPPGCDSGLEAFFRHNIIYSDSMLNAGAFGTVYINVLIDTNGTLSDFQIEKDNAGHGSAEEAIRVLKLMPRWIPGKMKGNPVNMRYTIPVKF